ncbi:hypothetical protein HDA32_002311 [Spinactinospora alkalitolerans]|uniref:Uncharacterized protein n=1 Tax=Spinactinospora alkalitolerans TaxID=687207 RepID=A0A852TU63_9ACTN|nr:Rv3235 family protein [Spinactinospora alkalitolerans]NYE47191.1 hypothetical protein [Spinactinospora alkalitolerans]
MSPHGHRPRHSWTAVRPRAALAGRARPVRHRRADELSQLVQFVAEVLAGQRDPSHLRAHMSERAYQTLRRRAGAYRCARRPRLRAAHLHCPAPGVTEVSGVVDCGPRHRALALRVDSVRHAWLCTHVETDVGHPM